MVVPVIYDDSVFTDVRLPSSCTPHKYNVTLEPDLEAFTFKGHVSIEVTINEPNVDRIVLHALELNLTDVSFVPDVAGDGMSSIKQVIICKKSETAVLAFDKPIKKGPGKLAITFNGTLNDKNKGFYRSKYPAGTGQHKYAAVSKFEPTFARYALPCWDEPAIKAKFDVTLIVSPDRVALSNMDVIEDTVHPDGKKVVKFRTSPIMSTYLLAFVVGEFDFVEGFSKARPVRVFTPLGMKQQGLFSLDVAIKSLDFFEKYFAIEYPLPKLDLIAIADFASGAMENWGIITFRETRLLADSNDTSTSAKQEIALTVAHEIAHQWFGNLVTMEWWTHLWLNEGFASFMEYLCVDSIFPDYDIWAQFVTDSFARALELDALHSSHPIEVPVNHPSELYEIFDAISYSKGASVIKMLHSYITDEHFKEGLRSYLTKFAYKNATTEHLWEALQAASNKPVCEVMAQWTKQKGFPWLAVGRKTEGKSASLTITQKKFASNGELAPDEVNIKWVIPVTVATGATPNQVAKQFLLRESSEQFMLDDIGSNWIKFNPGAVGFYRTAYPEDMIKELLPAISSKTLPPLDRFNILNDYFALCQAGNVSTVALLQLIEAFSGEDDYTVWSSIDQCLGVLDKLLSYTDFQQLFHSFGRKLYNTILSKLTWSPSPGEKHTNTLIRALAINRLILFDDKAVVAEAKRRYQAHVDKTSVIPADIRGAVYKVAANGDDAMFESLFTIYRKSDLQEEKERAAIALGTTRDKIRIGKVLDLAMSDEVRNQDKLYVIIYVARTAPGRELVWNLLRDRSGDFRKLYENSSQMAILIKNVTKDFASEEKALEISKYFQENKFAGTERNVQQSIETIRQNTNWLKRDSASVKTFLSSLPQ